MYRLSLKHLIYNNSLSIFITYLRTTRHSNDIQVRNMYINRNIKTTSVTSLLVVIIFNFHSYRLLWKTTSMERICKINVREYRRGNQKWTIQRNWQHRDNKPNPPTSYQSKPKFSVKTTDPFQSQRQTYPHKAMPSLIIFVIVYIMCYAWYQIVVDKNKKYGILLKTASGRVP